MCLSKSFYNLATIYIDMVFCRMRIASEIGLLKCEEARQRSRPSGLKSRKRAPWQQTWPQQGEESEVAGEANAEP